MRANWRPRRNILLVEDDDAVATMLTDGLGARGFNVQAVPTAAAAEAIAAEVDPELIIVDLMLPDANGLVLCANLRERLGIPIVICSATQRRDDPVLALKLGADD